MGTNFYRIKKITEADLQKMKDLIDSKSIISRYGDEDTLDNFIHQLKEEVHICKRSAGWFICFDHNWGKYYKPNRKSLEEFLSQPDTEIVDEYGESYSPQKFWDMVDEWNKREDLWDSKAYGEWERQRNPSYYDYICHDDINKCKELFNITTAHNDFCVDNLRFAVFTDFC